MDKINFKNLPDKTTSITAEKLNKIQENVEKAINEKSSLPVGGDEGQILAKASNQDNDVEWIDNIGQGGGDTLPIGAILPFSGDIIPNGWLLCDGSVIEQEDYPELFEVLAGNYGIISREEIRLPDLRGKVTIGKDSTDADFDTLGNTGGGTAQENLRVSAVTYGSSESQIYRGQTLISKNRNETSGAVTIDNCDLDLMPPYIVTNYIIKAKMTIVTIGEVIQENDTATTENVYSAKAIDNKLKANITTGQEVATNEYIDRERVYVKRISTGSLPNATTTSVATGLNFSEIDIQKVNGMATRIKGGEKTFLPIPNNGVEVWLSGNNLNINCTINRSDFSGYVNIYYTKNA